MSKSQIAIGEDDEGADGYISSDITRLDMCIGVTRRGRK